jgi:hypothetical protein
LVSCQTRLYVQAVVELPGQLRCWACPMYTAAPPMQRYCNRIVHTFGWELVTKHLCVDRPQMRAIHQGATAAQTISSCCSTHPALPTAHAAQVLTPCLSQITRLELRFSPWSYPRWNLQPNTVPWEKLSSLQAVVVEARKVSSQDIQGLVSNCCRQLRSLELEYCKCTPAVQVCAGSSPGNAGNNSLPERKLSGVCAWL